MIKIWLGFFYFLKSHPKFMPFYSAGMSAVAGVKGVGVHSPVLQQYILDPVVIHACHPRLSISAKVQ